MTFEEAKRAAKQRGERNFTWGGRDYNVEQTFATQAEENAAFDSVGIGPSALRPMVDRTVGENAWDAVASAPPGQPPYMPGAGTQRTGWPPAYGFQQPPTPVTGAPGQQVNAWSNLINPQPPQPMAEGAVVEPTWQGAAQAERFPLTGVGGQPAAQAVGWPPAEGGFPLPAAAPFNQAPIPAAGPQATTSAIPGVTEQPFVGNFPLAPGVDATQAQPQPGAGMDMANAQLPPEAVPGPPKTPEEYAQRKQGWIAFLDRVQSDPNLAMMFLKMGTMMAQPVPVNQSPTGHLAGAIQGGVDYQRTVNLQNEENIRRNAAVDEAGRRTDIYSRDVESQIGARTQATEQAGKEFPIQLDLLRERIYAAKTEGDYNKIRTDIEKWKGSPERLARLDAHEARELDIREKAALAALEAARANRARVEREPSTMELARLKQSIESQAARAYVASVETDILAYARSQGERLLPKGAVLPTDKAAADRMLVDAAKNEFFSQYNDVAREYYKAQAQAGLSVPQGWGQGVQGPPPDVTVEEPRGGQAQPTPDALARAARDPNLRIDVIRGPDGKLTQKIVPARPVQLPGAGAAGAAPAPGPMYMVPNR